MGTSEQVEEEEYLVHVDFNSLLDSDTLKDPNLFFKVIGIDSEKPIMQIGDQVFTGTYHDIPGTSLFFEEDDNKIADDAVFAKTSSRTLQYKYKTRKSLVMQRVFIKKKDLTFVINGSHNAEEMTENGLSELEHLELLQEDRADSSTNIGNGIEPMDLPMKKKAKLRSRDSQLKMSMEDDEENPKNSENILSPKKTGNGLEPVAGPSWAPDISQVCKDVLSTTVNADEMSRLIAEQMTLESDINLQNTAHGDDKTK